MDGGSPPLPDSRYVALPCILVSSVLQYLRFAKKPLSAPFHRISDRLAKRCVLLGMLLELVGCWLLPLCEAYPMNASCLVCLFFVKETKRSASIRLSEVFACLMALSAWLLPFVDPLGGRLPKAMPLIELLDVVLAPRSCIYVAVLLVLGVLVHCFRSGTSALGSCAGPGMNFGVSAVFVKAFVGVVAVGMCYPMRLDPWAAAIVLAGMMLWIRGAAAVPLRRAFEAHDKLCVLSSYGVTSSLAAALTGSIVYRETDLWGPQRQLLSVVLAATHCWGMTSLASAHELRDSDSRDRAKGEGSALQMAELPGRKKAGSGSAADSELQLFNFEEGGSHSSYSVDLDSIMEDKLLAHALGPQAVGGGFQDDDVDGQLWSTGSFPAGPQFDADFEEIMRRFDEDDRRLEVDDGDLNWPIAFDPDAAPAIVVSGCGGGISVAPLPMAAAAEAAAAAPLESGDGAQAPLIAGGEAVMNISRVAADADEEGLFEGIRDLDQL